MKYTTHLRCRLTKNSPRRTKSTPAGVFCTLLASASSISKGLRQMVFQYRHGRRWFHAEASFSLEKLDVEQLYKDVQLLNRLFSKANGKWYFRTDRDVRGSAQQQVCLQTCSPKMYMDVHFLVMPSLAVPVE